MFSLKVIEQEKKPNGVIIYQGPSQINGKPITVVVTSLARGSKNGKTGEMAQVYILPKLKPVIAIYNGEDESVCGDCIHRYVNGAGSCYVNPAHGPLGVWRGVHLLGSYKKATPLQASQLVAGRIVRLGAYGDPAAVPIEVWDTLLSLAAGWTGYTHQWRRKYAKGLNRYCMASCETLEQRQYAKRLGWRTFRIREDSSDVLDAGEFECPASKEQGKRLTCEECQACNGGETGKASPAIIAHGTNWKVIRLRKLLRLMRMKKKYRGGVWN